MHKSKTVTPAGDPDQKKQYAWHRHPALIAAIPAVFALIGSILTIVLGQSGVLPAAINPAPPRTTILSTTTATATTTATSTVTETVTETPVAQITGPGSSSTPQTLSPGTLAITIRMGASGRIGPGEYRAGSLPTASAQVLDETGNYPATGCYPTWVLKRGSVVIKTARGESCGQSFYLSRDSLEVRGVYSLTVSVVTEAGAKGTKTEDFKVS
ncbi:hypothetical protein [Kribbella sp. VKM Ac-2569]|uniref:hypothetical protein n=1 Tax=Kribbella sp. VKM Ac-2569 TaxID=2512220 RepID=UPI00102C38E4|nr:hypothetical protein [Kribbella sp. VKM Ac-2569]